MSNLTNNAIPLEREPEFLSLKKAAAYLKVSTRHLRNAIESGKITAYRFAATKRGTYRIERQDLERYIEESMYKPAGPLASPKHRPNGKLFRALNSDRLLAAWERQSDRPSDPLVKPQEGESLID